MSIAVVFKSQSRSVTDHVEAWRKKWNAFSVSCNSYGKEILGEEWEGEFVLLTSVIGAVRLSGFVWDGFPPSGWKRRQGSDGKTEIVPNQRVKGGKALAKSLEQFSIERIVFEMPGMPSNAFTERGICAPNHGFYGGVHWVSWIAEPKGVDLTIWERAKLSEYYAARGE